MIDVSDVQLEFIITHTNQAKKILAVSTEILRLVGSAFKALALPSLSTFLKHLNWLSKS